ncbi:DUF6760 family protein [Streptomyces wuyuanensis]|uniref:DUF6760 family protein n=1 Tax=Streptomyces wuyuanensis TaxID=1196353 RepID=UPI003F5424CB
MWHTVHPSRSWERPGGIVTYPQRRLREEVGYVAYHFHWPRDDILGLPHHERLCWVREINRINTRLNSER